MENGILLLNKSAGVTSRHIDNAIGKMFSTHKVGHLGTLDPFASGLLVIAVNKGTKFLPFFVDSPKTYFASLALGEATSTGDTEGEITVTKEIPPLDSCLIQNVLDSFIGDSFQIPPMTSAIKVNGTELYKLAHQGQVIEREKRPVHIYSMELVSFTNNRIDFITTVSTGTYVRVLGEDIALRLGTIGHLTALKRLSIGNFSIENALTIDKINENSLLDPTPFLLSMPHYEIEEKQEKWVKDGRKMTLPKDYGERVLFTFLGKAIAVYQKESGFIYTSLRGLF